MKRHSTRLPLWCTPRVLKAASDKGGRGGPMAMPSRPHHCCLQLSCASTLHPFLLRTRSGILKAQSLKAWTKCAFGCCGQYIPEKPSRSGARSAGVLQPTDVCVQCLCVHLLSAHSITQPGSEPYGHILTPSLQCLSSSAVYLSRIIFCCKTVVCRKKAT